MASKAPQLNEQWLSVLSDEFSKPYFTDLKEFLLQEKQAYSIFPPGAKIFEAFNRTPFNQVKVVILGQDPYHGPGQAEGLSFSVPVGVKIPPSLQNMYKELNDDLGIPPCTHGHLGGWARQGVLLLNTVLTVRASTPASHKDRGWEIFTDKVLEVLNEKRDNLVFMLWGKHAQEKSGLLDASRHLILQAAHPSPFSAHKGFLGCRHFSQVNEYLEDFGRSPIQWNPCHLLD